MKRIVCLTLALVFLGSAAVADGVRPVTLQVKEQEAGKLRAQWRVPKQLPTRAIPSPVLPDSCAPSGERSLIERPGAWFLSQTYTCPDGLAGQTLKIDYPFLNVTVSTLMQVELLTGERYARMLVPGEDSWQVPASAAGGVPAWMRTARQAVLTGAAHFVGHGVHFALLLSLLLVGRFGIAIRLASTFTAGQLAAVLLVSFSGLQLTAPVAEIGIAVAAALLAREALRPAGERRQLVALAAAAGLVHGLGIGSWGLPGAPQGLAGVGSLFPIVLGMDAMLLLSTTGMWGLSRLVPRKLAQGRVRTVAAYGIAVVAIALVVAAPGTAPGTAAGETERGLKLDGLPIPDGAGAAAGSRRVAAQFPDATFQSFVAVDAFEVRHEVLVRLSRVADRVGLEPSGELPVELQDEVKRRVRDLVAARTTVAIDGTNAEPVDERIDFLGLNAKGALPRQQPIPEPVEDAWIGVTTVFLTASTPGEVAVQWEGLGQAEPVPATVTDPESSQSVELTAGQPVLRWRNELSEDPAPVVRAIAVEPVSVWVPLGSLLPLGGVVFFGLAMVRGRRSELSLAVIRVMMACALLLGPVGGVVMALPFSAGSTPDADRGRQILAGVVPNVYRAFEFPTESAVYDRLALSITGETLTEVYLEHRRAVRMEERGGARARIEAVEIVEVDSVEPGDGGGFTADAAWTVGGTVTHFGHRHFRQNRYDVTVEVVPDDGIWKIRSIEILDEQRLR